MLCVRVCLCLCVCMLGVLPILLASWLIKQLLKKNQLYSCFCVLAFFLNLIVRCGLEVRFKLYQPYLPPRSCQLMKKNMRREYTLRKRLPKQQLISKPCQLHLQSRFLIFTLVFFSLDYCLQLGFLYCYIPPTINLFFRENRTDQVILLPNALWKLLTTLLIKSNLLPWPSTPYNPPPGPTRLV